MALTEAPPIAPDEEGVESRPAPTAIEQLVGTANHKTVGRMFIGLSLLFLTVDLVVAALVNFDIAADGDLLDGLVAVRLMMNHPFALLLCGAMPLMLGLAIYVVPMQVGSPTIAFPRAAAASMWTWLLGTILFSTAMTANGSYGGSNVELARLGPVSIALLCCALLVGVVCVMVTVMTLRPTGMTIARIPHFSFSMLVTGTLWLVTLPAVVASVVLFHIQHPSAETLAARAYPAIEWLFHQPALYIAAIPVLGIVADVISGVSGSRIKMYGLVQSMIGLFGFFAFGAWAQSEISRQTAVWAVLAVGAGLPVLAVLGASLDGARRGTPKPLAALGAAILAPLVLLLAAATGLIAAVDTFGDGELVGFTVGGFAAAGDQESGPGLVMGQFYLVIGAVVIGGLAACWYWGSRLVDGGLSEVIGKLALLPAFLGAILFGGAHLALAIVRPSADDGRFFAGIAGTGAVLLAAGTVAALGSLLMRLMHPGEAEATFDGTTLEWADGAALAGLGESPISSPYPLLDQKGAE